MTTGMRTSPLPSTRIDAVALATLSLGAAAIHFAVIGEHFSEYAPFGIFFSLIAWFEALWAVAYVARPTRQLAVGALVVNAATVMIWGWAHLFGLPFGPEPGHVEPTGIIDLMATLFEVVLVVGLASLVVRRTEGPVSTLGRASIMIGLVGFVVAGTSVALAQQAVMGG
jgi:hypothetical protein